MNRNDFNTVVQNKGLLEDDVRGLNVNQETIPFRVAFKFWVILATFIVICFVFPYLSAVVLPAIGLAFEVVFDSMFDILKSFGEFPAAIFNITLMSIVLYLIIYREVEKYTQKMKARQRILLGFYMWLLAAVTFFTFVVSSSNYWKHSFMWLVIYCLNISLFGILLLTSATGNKKSLEQEKVHNMNNASMSSDLFESGV